jgi:hypothetical protein
MLRNAAHLFVEPGFDWIGASVAAVWGSAAIEIVWRTCCRSQMPFQMLVKLSLRIVSLIAYYRFHQMPSST